MHITQHTINTPYMVGPVHCYTAELGGDLVLFDTGPPTADGQRYLKEHVDFGDVGTFGAEHTPSQEAIRPTTAWYREETTPTAK